MEKTYYQKLCNAVVFGLLSTLAVPQLMAQERGWHASLSVAEQQCYSTFKSSGPGFSAGIAGGYQFNNVVSLDAAVSYGKSDMEARDCCAGYWLSDDGVRYNASVLDMPGTAYGDLTASVSMCRAQLAADINLLGMLKSPSRWSVSIAPAVSAIMSRHTISHSEQSQSGFNIGLGGSLNIGYRLSRRIGIAVYSGVTQALGDGLDGLERHNHSANLIWETGVKISWIFNKVRK